VSAAAEKALSPRQTEVLRLTGQGLTLEEIAAQLGITPRTAKAHSDEIRRRLGVTSRLRMAAAAHSYRDPRLPDAEPSPSVVQPVRGKRSRKPKLELTLVDRTVLLAAIAEVKESAPDRTTMLVLNRLERFVRGIEVVSA
jgi:DNA-binding CsgD family transcriptional regulator